MIQSDNNSSQNYEIKFASFIEMCRKAKQDNIPNVVIATPQVLGDNYELSFTDRFQAIYTRDLLLDPAPDGASPTPQKVEPGSFDRSIPDMEDPD